MRVLVTGGSGFIGSHVIENLERRDHSVVIMDRKQIKTHHQLVFGDVRDATLVNQAVGDCDAVIHLAGILGTAEQVQNPMPAIETNILGGINVFQAVRQFEVPAVYITLGNHWMNNTYSITKSTTERFALMANQEWGTRIAIVRAVNAYGPRQKTGPVKKIVPSLVMASLRDEPMHIYGDGMQVADMVYVTDLAEALVRALVMDHGCFDSIMECGPGLATTVNDMANEIRMQTGTGTIVHTPMRPGEPEGAVVMADPSTLKPLDMYPEWMVQLDKGIARSIEYYKTLL